MECRKYIYRIFKDCKAEPEEIEEIKITIVKDLDRTKISTGHIEEEYQITRLPKYGKLYKNRTDTNSIQVDEKIAEKGTYTINGLKFLTITKTSLQ